MFVHKLDDKRKQKRQKEKRKKERWYISCLRNRVATAVFFEIKIATAKYSFMFFVVSDRRTIIYHYAYNKSRSDGSKHGSTPSIDAWCA